MRALPSSWRRNLAATKARPAKKKRLARKKKARKKARVSKAPAQAAPAQAAPRVPGRKKSTRKKGEAKPSEYLKAVQALETKGDEFHFDTFTSDAVETTIKEFVSTGNLELDRVMGGGWPVGGISECRGYEGVGKSVVLDQSFAQAQRNGFVTVFLDSEKSRDAAWTKTLGVDPAKLIATPVDCIEDALDAVDRLLTVQEALVEDGRAKPMLIGWDSLGATPPRVELEGAADDAHVAVAARRIKQGFRRLTQRLYRARVAFVFANHVYRLIGPFGGGLQSSGGSGVRFHTHVRLDCARTGQITLGSDREVVGHTIKVRTVKNRVIGVQPAVEVGLIYGAGIDNSYTLFEWGVKKDVRWIQKGSQGWYYLYDPWNPEQLINFKRKWLGLGAILTERADIYQAMVNGFLEEGKSKDGSKEENGQAQAEVEVSAAEGGKTTVVASGEDPPADDGDDGSG